MSKTSRRPKREQIKEQRKQYKKAQKELRQDEKAKGLHAHSHSTISNHKCGYESVEQESPRGQPGDDSTDVPEEPDVFVSGA